MRMFFLEFFGIFRATNGRPAGVTLQREMIVRGPEFRETLILICNDKKIRELWINHHGELKLSMKMLHGRESSREFQGFSTCVSAPIQRLRSATLANIRIYGNAMCVPAYVLTSCALDHMQTQCALDHMRTLYVLIHKRTQCDLIRELILVALIRPLWRQAATGQRCMHRSIWLLMRLTLKG